MHFDPVAELHSLNDFRKPFESAQSSPTFLGRRSELVDHGQHSVARQAALGAVGPVPDGGEARLDDVAAANVNPVLGRKRVERIGLTLLFLGLVFRRLYVVPQACAPGTPCADPKTSRRQRLTFWMVAVLMLGLLAVPSIAPLFY